MWPAIALRMCDIGCASSPWPAGIDGVTITAAAAGPADGNGVTVAAEAASAPVVASTSAFVIRPPSPVPATVARSIPRSWASLRTIGDKMLERGPRSGIGAGGDAAVACAGNCWACGAGWGGGGGGAACVGGGAASAGAAVPAAALSSAAGAAWGADAPLPLAPEPSSISIPAVPTGTVAPSATKSFVTVPATGDGTSVSTLSVEISNNGSSALTSSPSALSHFKIVPSTIVSPSCGIWIDVTTASSPRGQTVDRGLDVGDLRQERVLERGRERHGVVRRCEPNHRRVQMLERLLRDDRGDLRTYPEEVERLVQHQRARRLLDRPDHGLLVDRIHRPQVDDLDGYAASGEGVRRLQRLMHHRAVGDDRDVVAGPLDRRGADRDELLWILRDVLLDPAIQRLVLEEQARVVVADRGLQQPLRVRRERGAHDLDPTGVREPRLRVHRVEVRCPHAAAARRAQHHRCPHP